MSKRLCDFFITWWGEKQSCNPIVKGYFETLDDVICFQTNATFDGFIKQSDVFGSHFLQISLE